MGISADLVATIEGFGREELDGYGPGTTLESLTALERPLCSRGPTGRMRWRWPRARIVGSATASTDPVIMLTAGQAAVEKVLARAGPERRGGRYGVAAVSEAARLGVAVLVERVAW